MAQLPRIFLFCRTAWEEFRRQQSEKMPQPEAAEKNMT